MLTERQSQILNTIVDEYINIAMPVSSGMIFDKGILNVSCPTIRNEMAELTSMGFLVQPHTSAGRVPTESGYRFFVDELAIKRQASIGKEQATADIAREVSRRTNDLVIFFDNKDGEIKYLGLRRLFENPEFRTHESVVSTLGELERFENYSDRIFEYLRGDLEIFIGSENPFFEDTKYSMISSRVNDDFIALLGPMRMNYKINISLLS